MVTSNERSIVWSPSMRTSGSTIGTIPASWQSAAYRASVCAFTSMQYALGRVSVMVYVARHLANRAPSEWYSARRSRRPSRPSVTVSPSASASGLAPRSTLMPGMMPWSSRIFTSGVPSVAFWRMVSSKRITPLMKSAAPFVVKSISR